jgi:hypothetical protein
LKGSKGQGKPYHAIGIPLDATGMPQGRHLQHAFGLGLVMIHIVDALGVYS